MGGLKHYLQTGGFTEILYQQVGETISAGGISAKVIDKNDGPGTHDGLPMYSNTAEVYLKLSDKTNLIEQARIYTDRKACFDFDWGHTHDADHPKGIVHVHEWFVGKDGQLKRGHKVRLMNNDEMARYGELLKKAFPNIKFR